MDPSQLHRAFKSAQNARTGVVVYTTTVGAPVVAFFGDDYNFECSLRRLSLKEQLRIRNISDAHSRAKQLATRLFTKLVLNYVAYELENKDHYDPWAEIPFEYGQYGKPSLALQNTHPFLFSASTSNDILSIVVLLGSSLPVGVDLSHASQTAISATDFMDQFHDMFHPLERAQLNAVESLDRRYVSFNQLWTLKEAFTKLLGSGLNVDLASFHFSYSDLLVVRNALIPQREVIEEMPMVWQDDIKVDIGGLVVQKSPFLQLLETTDFFCYLAVLADDGRLPVVVSIITQQKTTPKVLHLDLLRVLA